MATPLQQEKPCGLRIHLLGPFAVWVEGRPLPPLRSRKVRSLLALLVLRAGSEVARSWLANVLWPGSPESTALATLRRDLTSLRRALGPAAGRLRSPTPRTLCLDLAELEADVRAFDAAGRRGDPASLEQAVALYRGPLLETCAEEWLFPERQVREQIYLQSLERLAEHATARGDAADAEAYLRRAVVADPLREMSQRALMRLLAAQGSYAAAAQVYHQLRQTLYREINAEPDAETQALFECLRADARRQAGSRRPEPQAGAAGVPCLALAPPSPLPTPARVGSHAVAARRAALHGSRAAEPSHNLPVPLTRFIGREAEIAAAKRLLAATRLLTVTGAGGCGKTRIALQMAAAVQAEYPDGVWLVELAPLADLELVPQALASVLGVREQPDYSTVELLQRHLASRCSLLLFDNCEHLLGPVAALADCLLQFCPRLRILATSREALNIAGEQIYRVPPLSLPACHAPPSTLIESEAVQLFAVRAGESQPGFEITPENAATVAQICRRLDGMPLAIELAAARVKALSVAQIAAKLDDLFGLLSRGSRTAMPRHQTLQALIDWSCDLLSEPERELLRRLSVFAGGWSLEAAEAVGGQRSAFSDQRSAVSASLPGWAPDRRSSTAAPAGSVQKPDAWGEQQMQDGDVLDLLTRLVEKSLVQYEPQGGTGRYRLLESVRQYACDRLLQTKEAAAVRDRHLAFFLQLAEVRQKPRDGSEWKTLEPERDNLRAALEWCLEGDDGSLALRLAAAMLPLWLGRGPLAEGRRYLARVLARDDTQAPTAARAKALNLAAMLAGAAGGYEPEQKLHEECLAIRRALGDQKAVAGSLVNLAYALRNVGQMERAVALVEESRVVAEESGDAEVIGYVLAYGGSILAEHGDPVRARAYLERAQVVGEAIGNQDRLAVTHRSLALVDRAEGDLASAWAHLRQSLVVSRDSGFQRWIPNRLNSVAGLAALQGQAVRAARLFGAAEALREELGIHLSWGERQQYERDLALARAQLAEPAFSTAWEEGRALGLQEAVADALELAARASDQPVPGL